MTMPKNLGMILLAVWLILYGLLTNSFLKLNFAHGADLVAVFAIVTAVVILVYK